MIFELYGTGTVIGKNQERRFFGTNYVVGYKADIDGQRVIGTKKVGFDEYIQMNVGDEIPVRLFSGDGSKITTSRTDAGLESIFGAFVHPSLREHK